MLQSAEFWVAVAFVVFLALVWRPASSALLGGLDERARRIAADLEEAKRLRREAEALLEQCRVQQKTALSDAAAITTQAAEDAKTMQREAAAELEVTVKRREAQALDRITQAEAAAVADLRAQAADIALTATRALLNDRLSGKDGDRLIEAATADLPRLLS